MHKEFKPTYLYIKIHNTTGLKYFGKTTNDPFKYRGSGLYWLAHLKKHGSDISTEIVGYYTNQEECTEAAVEFSTTHNIIKAVNENNTKIWANQINENGTDGGATTFGPRSEEVKRKISEKQKGKIISEETKLKIKSARALQDTSYLKGRIINAEWRTKISDTLAGRTISEDVREKMREGQLNRWKKYREQKGNK
jgi:NUMOD3 motif